MTDEPQITPAEERALDDLGANFDALLARTPEPHRRRTPDRRFVLAGAAGLTTLVVLAWAVFWPDSRLSVDSALASISDVAAAQPTPGPKQFVETESTVTNLLKASTESPGPPGTLRGGFYTGNVFQHAWRSMTLPGRVDTRYYARGAKGSDELINSSTASPSPNYRIGSSTYSPMEIEKYSEDPSALMDQINDDVRKVAPRSRVQTKWGYLVLALQAVTPPLPSSIRAELIRGLESLPGVGEPKARRDPQGREGLQLELIDDGLAYHAVFDPKNSLLRYSETVIEKDGSGFISGAKRGQVFQSYLLLSSKVTDSVPRK